MTGRDESFFFCTVDNRKMNDSEIILNNREEELEEKIIEAKNRGVIMCKPKI